MKGRTLKHLNVEYKSPGLKRYQSLLGAGLSKIGEKWLPIFDLYMKCSPSDLNFAIGLVSPQYTEPCSFKD